MVETRNLPSEQIAELADHLSAAFMDFEVGEAWTCEAIRRLDEIESGREKPIPGEEVMKRARKILRKGFRPSRPRVARG